MLFFRRGLYTGIAELLLFTTYLAIFSPWTLHRNCRATPFHDFDFRFYFLSAKRPFPVVWWSSASSSLGSLLSLLSGLRLGDLSPWRLSPERGTRALLTKTHLAGSTRLALFFVLTCSQILSRNGCNDLFSSGATEVDSRSGRNFVLPPSVCFCVPLRPA